MSITPDGAPRRRGSAAGTQAEFLRFERAMQVFERVVDLPAERRADALADACGSDANLRAEVEAMLASSDAHEGPIETGSGFGLAAQAAAAVPLESFGVLRGQYRLGRVLGEGGMGLVYEAEQAVPRRKVAIKALRLGLATPRARQRFEQEAHILGRLQHPNIAQVFEAGIELPERDTQAFLVLELVDGPTLTQWAQDQGLGSRGKVELFLGVCDAIAHAHQRGVIHRDLKPSNVLVTSAGVPKVLDFGVARLADDEGRAGDARTVEGQLIGTLAYMSPEQLSGDPGDVDTRVDVFALGALLYELLAGRQAFPIEGRTLPEQLVARRNARTPRLADAGGERSSELDAIVSRALAYEKDRRYASVSDLAADLRRWLTGEPVSARGDSTWYVLHKRIARHRIAAAFALLALSAVLGFSVYAWRQAAIERDLRASADEALRRSNIERGRLLAMTGGLLEAEELVWGEHLARPSAHSKWTLFDLYSRFPVLRTFGDAGDAVTEIALSHDERILVGTVHGKSTSAWDPTTGEPRDVLGPASAASFVIGWSPVRDDLFHCEEATDQEGGARLSCWSVSEQVVRWRSDRLERIAHNMNIARDGSRIVFVVAGSIHVLDANDGTRIAQIDVDDHQVNQAVFGRDTAHVISGGEDGSVREWHVATGAPVREIARHPRSVRTVQLAPDGRTLGYGGELGVTRYVDLAGERESFELPAPGRIVRGVRFDGRSARAAILTNTHVELWDLERREMVGTAQQNRQPAFAACFDARGTRLFTGGSGGPLRVHDLEHRGARRTVTRALGAVSYSALSPDGQWIAATAAESGTVGLIAVDTGLVVRTLELHTEPVTALAFDARSERLFVGSNDERVSVWNVRDGSLLSTTSVEPHGISSFVSAPVADLLVLAGGDGSLILHDTRGAGPVTAISAGLRPATSIDAFADRAVTCHMGRILQLWSLGERRPLYTIQGTESVYCAAFCRGGERVAVGTWKGPLQVWDVGTRTLLGSYTGHAQQIVSIDCDLASGLIATASLDGTVKLWDVDVPVPLVSFPFESSPRCVRFRADGASLLVTGGFGVAEIDLHAYDEHIAGNESYQRLRAGRR